MDVSGVPRRHRHHGQARRSICLNSSKRRRAGQSQLGRRRLLLVLQFGSPPGMSDLSVLRFARHPKYNWASAAGMFLGHYVAWICAALLLVYWVRVHGVDPAQGKPHGPMVWDAVGWAGCASSSPAGRQRIDDLPPAGLAFPSHVQNMSRTTGTIIAGTVCTIAVCFPPSPPKLLDFVGLYGTILAPVGAIIVVDHYPRETGRHLRPSRRQGGSSSTSLCCLAWVIPVAVGLWVAHVKNIPAFFLPLPCWLACGAPHLVLEIAPPAKA